MKLIQHAAPSVEPVLLADAKAHLRVDLADDDDLITAMIVAARRRGEQYMQKSIITQTWYLYLDYKEERKGPQLLRDRYPDWNEIKLPFGPIQSVNAFEYLSSVGPSVWSAIDPSLYYVDLPGEEIVLTPQNSSFAFPCPVQNKSGFRISFTAGWGDEGTDVNADILLGLKTYLLHFYENRSAYLSNSITEVPLAGDFLLQPYRAMDY